MTEAAAIILCIVLGVLALFQLALILGAPLGQFAWGGSDRILPAAKRRGSIIAIVLYAVFAWVFLLEAGLVPAVVPEIVVTVAAWVIVAYLVLGIAMNAMSKSAKERWTMTPVSVVLAALAIVVAVG